MHNYKIVSFTMVNNESEIIESFIRYNSYFFDEMVVIDNGCTDSTIRILRNLMHEGYHIRLFDESLQGYDQFRLDNKYLKKIADECNPDIIVPLDADEFLTGDSDPRQLLCQFSLDAIYYVHWKWYVLTTRDQTDEPFIPRRLTYRLKNSPINYSDSTPVTKAIIPVKYFMENKLTLSMGHHTVFGASTINIRVINDLYLAHYRVISEEQLVAKTLSYTLRDIATMGNNAETAQRTNQLTMIENGSSMLDSAIKASYNGDKGQIVKDPLNLEFIPDKIEIEYGHLSAQSLAMKVYKTGQEMAIRAYNSERKKKEKNFIAPIVVWMQEVKQRDYLIPDPTNREVILASLYNVRGYLTNVPEISLLKANYRLIVTSDLVKFIPHKYVLIPNGVDPTNVREKLCGMGIEDNIIVTESEYRRKIGPVGMVYLYIRFVPSIIARVIAYVKRNGVSSMIEKVRNRF